MSTNPSALVRPPSAGNNDLICWKRRHPPIRVLNANVLLSTYWIPPSINLCCNFADDLHWRNEQDDDVDREGKQNKNLLDLRIKIIKVANRGKFSWTDCFYNTRVGSFHTFWKIIPYSSKKILQKQKQSMGLDLLAKLTTDIHSTDE
ncbi:unnamed protein product [Lactuca virosa]|uniref:Uncharacterized protein n=1 Tax=Lactuca virosa TaxID=75947 RepID=A0AAU9PJ09_9ASTR|nr:unnamed protein product [Lactuca virosa]